MGDVDRNQIAEMDEKSERRWLNRGRSKNNTAEDRDAKKSQSITITNDKGRRSQEQIDRMVREAEMFTQEDEKIKERIGAKNRFENYVCNMKSTIDDKDELADRIESDDKETMESALKEAMEWLDDNQKAEKEDYDDEKLKELEQVCNPIIRKVYEKSWQRSFRVR